MTIVLNDRRARYVASGGQTSFDVDFPIDVDTEVAVYHKVNATGVITLLTLTTDYTVTLDGAAPNTADVDLVSGAAVNDIITIEGETSPARDTDFTTGGDYFATTVNNAEDRQYRKDQEFERDRDRTVIANRVSPSTFDPTLPDIVGEASKLLGLNAGETGFEFTAGVAGPTGATGAAGADGADGADGDMINPMTTRGDIITGDAAGPGDPQRVAIGAANLVWKSDGTDPGWGDGSGVTGLPNDIAFNAGFGSDMSGEDLVARTYGELVMTRAGSFTGEAGYIDTVATGAAAIVDIEKNGTTIYTTLPEFAISDTDLTAGTLKTDGTEDYVSGDRITFKVTQIGSTIAGQKLRFTAKGATS